MPVVLSTMRTNKPGSGDRQQWGGSNVPLAGDIQRPEWSRGGKPCRHGSWTAYGLQQQWGVGQNWNRIWKGNPCKTVATLRISYLLFSIFCACPEWKVPVGSEDLKQWSTHSSSHQDLALGQGEGVGKSHLRRIHVCMRTHKLSNVTFSRRMVTAQLSPRWVIDP